MRYHRILIKVLLMKEGIFPLLSSQPSVSLQVELFLVVLAAWGHSNETVVYRG